MDIKYFLRFPYGAQGKSSLEHEFEMSRLASHYDYTGQLYQQQMSNGYMSLFHEIKSFKQVSFYKHFYALDFESVFSSAEADKRTIPYAYIYAKKDRKVVVDSLILTDFRITQFRYEWDKDVIDKGEEGPKGLWVMLIANAVT